MSNSCICAPTRKNENGELLRESATGRRFAFFSGLSCLIFAAFATGFVMMFLIYREQVSIQRATLDVLRERGSLEPRQTVVYYRTNETLQHILSVGAQPRAGHAGEDLTAAEEAFATPGQAAYFSGFLVSPDGCAPPEERVRLRFFLFFSRPETTFTRDEHYLMRPRDFLATNASTGYGKKMPTGNANGTAEGVWIPPDVGSASSESTPLKSRRAELTSRCVDTGYEEVDGTARRSRPWAVREMLTEGEENVHVHAMFSITNDDYVRGLRFIRVIISGETFDL